MVVMGIFQKRVEDFVCQKCGANVQGNGFTNHCPNCLFSKHVDVNPGDRQEGCEGMMEPIGLDQKNGKFVLIHRCLKCGIVKRNKVSLEDNKEELVKISSKDK